MPISDEDLALATAYTNRVLAKRGQAAAPAPVADLSLDDIPAPPPAKDVVLPPDFVGPPTQNEIPAAPLVTAPPTSTPPSAPKPPMEDPAFHAFAAQRAQAISDLKAAQGKAADARYWADVGNTFRRAGDKFAGRQTDEAAMQQRLDNAGQPVKDFLQQQALGQEQTKSAQADLQLQGDFQKRAMTVAMMDPASDLSKRAQLLATTMFGIPPAVASQMSADMLEAMQKGATFQEAKRQHNQRLLLEAQKESAASKHQDKALALSREQLAEHQRHNMAEEGLAGNKQALKPLAPAVESELQSYVDAIDAVDQLKDQQTKGWRSAEAMGVGEGGKYDAMKKALADSLAKAESKGRTNPAAAAKIYADLPKSGMFSDTQAQTQYETKRKELLGALANRVAALKASGAGAGEVAEFEKHIARLQGPASDAPAADPIAAAKSQLQPGEWLAVDDKGEAHAMAPTDRLEAYPGWKRVP